MLLFIMPYKRENPSSSGKKTEQRILRNGECFSFTKYINSFCKQGKKDYYRTCSKGTERCTEAKKIDWTIERKKTNNIV